MPTKAKKQQKIIDNYVNKPNELDIQMGQLQKNKEKQGKYIEELEKKVATLEREISTLKTDSHPPILKEKDVKKIMRRIKYLERKIK